METSHARSTARRNRRAFLDTVFGFAVRARGDLHHRVSYEPHQRVLEAMLTAGIQSKEEALKGSMAPGKLADFAVSADDPHTVSPDRIKDIQIVHTVVGGRPNTERSRP